ncbi:MAG: 3'-5' exonuclease domain-containing protein 2 [Tannerella sp.]|jgi:ribonuclease D|nr:3'-5' exonuclease domain-containing protein 2 [Tannerella sp.]
MTFANVITKEEIRRMPRERFEGKIVVVETAEKLNEAIAYLSACKEIGFDTETRPSFSKKTHYKMSLLQFSDNDKCFLIRLNKFDKMPVELEDFLKNDSIRKIGLSLRDDFHGLHFVTRVSPDNVVDLQKYVKQFGIEEMSLQKIYAILFGKKISKRERLTNWDSERLTEAQKMYAAIDAWACLRIYQYLEGNR